MDLSSIPYIATLFVIAGLGLIIVALVEISGTINLHVNNPKLVLFVGILFVTIGIISAQTGIPDRTLLSLSEPTPTSAPTDTHVQTSTPIPTSTQNETSAPAVTSTSTSTPSKSVKEWWSEGDTLYENGNYSEAVDCYNKAIELAPGNAELWNAKGYAFKEMGVRDQTNSKAEQAKEEYKQAITAFDEALRLSNFDFPDAQDGKDFCQNRLSSLP